MFGIRPRFTSVVAVLLLAVSLAEAQLSTAIPRIGLLADATSWEPLRRGLRDLGYVEGKRALRLRNEVPKGETSDFRSSRPNSFVSR
jgi:hypothetical protein